MPLTPTVTVRASLRYVGGNVSFQSQPTSFIGSIDGTPTGPSPGSLLIATDPGTDINLSELTLAGYCVLQNYDQNNYVTYGNYDHTTSKFYPLGELQPGEIYVLRLSRHLGYEYLGTGTGIAGPTLRFKADTAPCQVLVAAFEA